MTMMTLVFVPTALAMLVGTPAPTAWQPRAPPAVALASSSGELPNMYRERWSGEKETSSVVAKVRVSKEVGQLTGALVGSSLMAIAGVGASSLQIDQALSQLRAVGLFEQNERIIDILAEFSAAANMAGLILLPLVALYMVRPETTASEAAEALDAIFVEAEACLVDAQICGSASFDSVEDGMVCVEDTSGGKLRWVCA